VIQNLVNDYAEPRTYLICKMCVSPLTGKLSRLYKEDKTLEDKSYNVRHFTVFVHCYTLGSVDEHRRHS